jgi:hypothetical protein
MASLNDIILSNIPEDGDLISSQESYDHLARMLCDECLYRAKGFLANLHKEERMCVPCANKVLASMRDRKAAAFLRARSGINPIRQGKSTGWAKEDIMFSGQKSGVRGEFKVGFETKADGTVEAVIPLGAPPDSVGYNKNRAFQRERKEKAKVRCAEALDRKRERTHSPPKKEETQAEVMERYKALCDLVGAEEADKMIAKDFWMD